MYIYCTLPAEEECFLLVSFVKYHRTLIKEHLREIDPRLWLFVLQSTIASKINVTPQRCLLAHFEATLNLSRSEFTCP